MIIKLMVDMVAPQPSDEICDPACGTAGFLVAASEYVRNTHPHALTDAALILANPPFAGSLDYASTAKDLQRVVKTKKAELLFLALYPCLPG